MMLANVVVEKEGGRWAVKREGTDTVLSSHVTFQDALENGRYLAKQGGVNLIYEDEAGQAHQESPESRD